MPGGDLSMKVYDITNDEAQTRFPELPVSGPATPSISQFDKFQENLLQHYSTYCQMTHN